MNKLNKYMNDYIFIFHIQEEKTGQIIFFMKGADTVMASIVQYNDWLDEEVGFRDLLSSRQLSFIQ